MACPQVGEVCRAPRRAAAWSSGRGRSTSTSFCRARGPGTAWSSPDVAGPRPCQPLSRSVHGAIVVADQGHPGRGPGGPNIDRQIRSRIYLFIIPHLEAVIVEN